MVYEQYRLIYDPKNEAGAKVPVMPLLIVLDNGAIYEARSARGAVTAIVGNGYLDAEDSIDEWNYRVESARKEAMKALMYDINAVVFDNRYGPIKNNYASQENDPDYEEDMEVIGRKKTFKIHVETDRLFVLSLLSLSAIRILEREDSFIFRSHVDWSKLSQNGGADQCCARCGYRIEEPEEKQFCSVYNRPVELTAGTKCSSYNIPEGSTKEYAGGNYIELDVKDLVTQEWILV